VQIAAVYLSAGLSKWNSAWLSGDAVATALSLFDHGTPWGDALSRHELICRVLTWSVLALEVLGPVLLVATGRPGIRLALIAVFGMFHAASAALMSLGMFAFVGLAAWLAVIPAACWEWAARRSRGGSGPWPPATAAVRQPRTRRWERAIVAAALGIAGLDFLHDTTPWQAQPLPTWL